MHTGVALVDAERIPWSLIEKVTERPGVASEFQYDNGMRDPQRSRCAGRCSDVVVARTTPGAQAFRGSVVADPPETP